MVNDSLSLSEIKGAVSLQTGVYLTIVVPAFNEGKKIYKDMEHIYGYFRQRAYPFEVIVVNDGSKDNTVQEVERFRQKEPALRLVSYSPNRGKGHAVKSGVLEAQGDFIFFVDAGTCVPYEEIEKGIHLIQSGADIAFGSRGLAQSRILVRQPVYRRLGSKAFALVVRSLLGIKNVRDTQCGFKLFTKEAGKKIFNLQRTDGFMFDVEIIMRAKKLGYKIQEFPVDWSNDPDSRFNPIRKTIPQTIQILKILWYCR